MALQQLHHLDRSSSKFHDQLTDVLHGEVYQQSVPNLDGNGLASLVDYLDGALASLDPTGPGFQICLRELKNICGARLILPIAYIISPSLLNIGRQPVTSGRPGDAYEGTFNGSKVCVKRVQTQSEDGPGKVTKMIYQEAVVWKHLDHQNIVPLLGITSTPLQLVSEWMPNGNLTEYIRTHPDADRLGLLCDITDGLHYLHSRNVIHGDLKGPNVLVDATSHARITDFGLATVTRDPHSARSAPVDRGHNARWTAPEILTGQGLYYKEADVFSFAMVMIEAFTGAAPFGNNQPAAAVLAIMGGKRPARPTHSNFTDELWALMKRCWDPDPRSRPEISEVWKALRGFVPSGLGDEPPEKSTPARVLSNREPSELRRNEKRTRDLREKLESEERQQELEREGGGKGARERQERLENEKRQKELEREKEDREAWEREEKLRRERRQRELEQEAKEKDAREKLEREKWRRELEHQKRERDALERKMLEEEKRQRDLEREREAKEQLEREERELERGERELQERFKEEKRRKELEKKEKEAKEAARRERETQREKEFKPARRVSRRDAPDANASRYDLRAGNEPRNQSWVDMGRTPPESRGHPPPQTHLHRQEPPLESGRHTGAPKTQANEDREDDRGRRGRNIPDNTGGLSYPPALKRFISHRPAPHWRIPLITTIFADRNEVEAVKQLCGDDAQTFVDLVDEVLDDLDPQLRRKCSRAIYGLCGRQALLPRSLIIPLCYDSAGSPLCHGGFADVWKGRYRGQEVAAKVLRIYAKNDLGRIRRMFCREVVGWRTLRHPNILPLLGVTMTKDQLVMVSEWMANGTINEYVGMNVNADRLGLLGDVTKGLIYMHSQGIIHGDLKGTNILIDRGGHACLHDFSLLTMVSDQSTLISSFTEGGTFQWMSPELLDPERFSLKGSHPTKESDCYALGMVVYEVLSGRTPFAQSKAPVVIRMVLEGRRPARPQGAEGGLFTDAIWGVLELCWKAQPSERTSVEAVFQSLGGDPSTVQSASYAGGGVEADSDDQSDVTAKGSRPPILYGENVWPVPPQSRPDSVIDTDPSPPTRRGTTENPAATRNDHPNPTPRPPILYGENVRPVSPQPHLTAKDSILPSDPIRGHLTSEVIESKGVTDEPTIITEPSPQLRRRTRLSGWISNTFNTTPSDLTLPVVLSKKSRTSGPPTSLVDSSRGKGGNSLLTAASQSLNLSLTDRPNDLPKDHPAQRNQSKTPAPRTSTDATNWQRIARLLDAAPLKLAEIGKECKRRPSQELVDGLDVALDRMACDQDRHALLNILCKMCSRHRMIPESMLVGEHLNGELIEEYDGGQATVFRGKYKDRPVAVKTVHIYVTSDLGKCFSEFCREAVAWRHLRHPNILPFLGVDLDLDKPRLAMISEWMDCGNINEFLEKHEGVNRVQLLVEAANGLEYMHKFHMVHGDLKGANILINRSHRACLADFGLSTVANIEHHAAANASSISVASNASIMSFAGGGTTRWMSPELLDPDRFGTGDGRPTKQSDCYALGMVVYEVLCGSPPYWEIMGKASVIYAITEGVRPEKPKEAESLGFTEGLWGVVQRCWLVDAGARPDVGSILSHLNHATWAWERSRLG